MRFVRLTHIGLIIYPNKVIPYLNQQNSGMIHFRILLVNIELMKKFPVCSFKEFSKKGVVSSSNKTHDAEKGGCWLMVIVISSNVARVLSQSVHRISLGSTAFRAVSPRLRNYKSVVPNSWIFILF